MPRTTRFPVRIGLIGLAVALPLTLTLAACGGNATAKNHAGSANGQGGAATTPAAPDAKIDITPVAGAMDVDPGSAVQVSAAGGKLTQVTVTGVGDGPITGALNAASSTWTSSTPLSADTAYTVHASAVNSTGKSSTSSSTFTTLKPSSQFMATYLPNNGDIVGVGAPISLTFDHSITNRADVERRLQVTAVPPVIGAWHWFGSQRVDFRPQQYWAPGTHVTVTLRLDGANAGTGRYGYQNRTVNFTVGRSLVSTADMKTKQMVVRENGREIKQIPISAGKPGFDTWEGIMVTTDRDPDVEMNSQTVGIFGVQGYDIKDVKYAIRLTDSGTFVHAAPWNTGKFGVVNGSHGCIGMSTDDAEWFFNNNRPGDVVQVINSASAVVPPDNGFGDWNLSWPAWVAGSALG